mmetsp:Transcript_9203/g.21435  ORF Transcript_9203/g.21435 Transcript_9203/m.21435 type:complete len:243 (+) Transcript_9203:1301-2029(+)
MWSFQQGQIVLHPVAHPETPPRRRAALAHSWHQLPIAFRGGRGDVLGGRPQLHLRRHCGDEHTHPRTQEYDTGVQTGNRTVHYRHGVRHCRSHHDCRPGPHVGRPAVHFSHASEDRANQTAHGQAAAVACLSQLPIGQHNGGTLPLLEGVRVAIVHGHVQESESRRLKHLCTLFRRPEPNDTLLHREPRLKLRVARVQRRCVQSDSTAHHRQLCQGISGVVAIADLHSHGSPAGSPLPRHLC